LIGKKVHSRAAGLAAALLVLFRGINAIAGGHWIQTAHSRLFLSEMPTALALVLLTLWLVCWFQKPRDLIYPLLAGGTLGLSTLIRHNPWLLLPIILITALIVNWPHWKRWLGQAALFLLMLVAVISPWMIYSQKYIGTPFYFTMPLRGTIWKERYLPELEGTSLLPDMVPGQQFSLAGASVAGSGFMQNPSQIVQQQENPPSGFAVVARFVAVHFINNFNSTILILPGSLIFDDLDRTLSDPTSVWQQDWDGKVSGVLMFNITLALLGVVTAWRKWRLAGTAPLIVYLGYLIALAGARTSGGRYIVPVDWVVMLYYAIGLVQISAWLFGLEKGLEAHPDSKQTPAGKWRYFAAVGGLLLIVGMIPVAQEAFPKNVPPAGMDALPSKDWFLDKEIRQQDVTNFLDQEGAEVLSGRVVYPRLYRQDEGDHNECYESLLYPRLVFELLNEDGVHCVILPYDKSIENVKLHATQAVVFRCAESTAWAVLVPELDTALLRAPSVDSLRCPLPDPVCDNNRNCK
jgi:4-amino-4-deoxy-L-arabinose transferase-like glycosyltransferase